MRTDPPAGDELARMLTTMKANVLKRVDETMSHPAPARRTRTRVVGVTIAIVSLFVVGSAGAALATGIIPSPFQRSVPVATSTPTNTSTPTDTPTPSTTPPAARPSPTPVDEAAVREQAKADATRACTTIAAALDKNGNAQNESVWSSALLDAKDLIRRAADSDAAWAAMSMHITLLVDTPLPGPTGTSEQKNIYFLAYLPVASDCRMLQAPLTLTVD